MKQQERIYELITGERKYLADLELIISIFLEPLKNGDIIPESEREDFIKKVFANIASIRDLARQLSQSLSALQENYVISQGVGEAFLGVSHYFKEYIEYGAAQPLAKSLVAQQRASNPAFFKFLEDCHRRPELNRLSLESFLGRPTTRFQRYTLILGDILKTTATTSSAYQPIHDAIEVIRKVLKEVDRETGKANNALRCSALAKLIVLPEGSGDILRLHDERRQMIREGKLVYRRVNGEIDVTLFLFDHMLVVAKEREGYYHVMKHVFPLQLISFKNDLPIQPINIPLASITSHANLNSQFAGRHARTVAETNAVNPGSRPLSFTFWHHGRDAGSLTLQGSSVAEVNAWIEAIEKQKATLRLTAVQSRLLWKAPVDRPDMLPVTAVEGASLLFVGTPNGVSVGDAVNSSNPELPMYRNFRRIIDIKRVSMIDLHPDKRMLLVLADKTLYEYSIDLLGGNGNQSESQARGHKITYPVSFFKQGRLLGQPIVCTVDSRQLNSTVKFYRPTSVSSDGPNIRNPFGRFFSSNYNTMSGVDPLKHYRELFVPSGSRCVDFIENVEHTSKLFVGCDKGFQIIDIASLKTQALLNETDESLQFILSREVQQPQALFRLGDGLYLLCFQEYSFYVDRFGKRARGDWMINWFGAPTHFTILGRYIVAFDPYFIEIRDTLSGALVEIITARQLLGGDNHAPHQNGTTAAQNGHTTLTHAASTSAIQAATAPVAPSGSAAVTMRLLTINSSCLRVAIGSSTAFDISVPL
eukprot:jgi/Hompol1/806/HPOL_005421-RA